MADVRTPYFRTAITAIFKNWSALQLCVAHVSILPCPAMSCHVLAFSPSRAADPRARRRPSGWRR